LRPRSGPITEKQMLISPMFAPAGISLPMLFYYIFYAYILCVNSAGNVNFYSFRMCFHLNFLLGHDTRTFVFTGFGSAFRFLCPIWDEFKKNIEPAV
jgi:hypothetical protein